MVRTTKKTLQCPQTLSLLRVGSGNETTNAYDSRIQQGASKVSLPDVGILVI